MNTEIQTFNFNSATLRTLTNTAGDPWFVLKDCMSILGLCNPTETVKMFDDDEFSTTEVIDSIGRRQQTYIISEAGLYGLVLKSRKPEAHEFKRWVTHEVLPSIRKHGAYMTQQTLNKALTSPDFLIQLATRLKEEQEKVKALEPKAKALDDFTNVPDTLLVRDAAKLLSNAGTPIGEKELREWLSQHGWIYRHAGTWWAASERVKAGHLAMVESRTHGRHKDGSTFAFAPTIKITRKGLTLLHTRLGETRLTKALENNHQLTKRKGH